MMCQATVLRVVDGQAGQGPVCTCDFGGRHSYEHDLHVVVWSARFRPNAQTLTYRVLFQLAMKICINQRVPLA